DRSDGDTPSALTQEKSMRYEPPAINFHLGETPPREPQGGGEHTERAVGAGSKLRPPDIPVPPIFPKTRLARRPNEPFGLLMRPMNREPRPGVGRASIRGQSCIRYVLLVRLRPRSCLLRPCRSPRRPAGWSGSTRPIRAARSW